MRRVSRVARADQYWTIRLLWYARSHSRPWLRPDAEVRHQVAGPTIASALKITAGAAIRAQARRARSRLWTSGWFWQFVPSRFHMNATASSRKTSTPRFARSSRMSVISTNTRGFDQFRSHWNELNVVQTQRPSASRLKLPGAKSGKTSGRVAS